MDNKVKIFWSQEANSYLKKENNFYLYYEFNQRNNLVCDNVKEIKKNNKGGRLADFGCGSGFALTKINHFFDECYGIDLSNTMLQIAKNRRENSKCQFFDIPIENFDKKVDFIISIGVVEYLETPEVLIKKSSELLNGGGKA